MQKLIFPLLLGLGGFAILVSLGVWQTDRLAEKEAQIAQIEAQIHRDPVAIPANPKATDHQYFSVVAQGQFTGNEIRVLTSRPLRGPGYRIIAKFQTGGRAILVDRGFVVDAQKDVNAAIGAAMVVGNLFWPNEKDRFIPDPDVDQNIWFARDLDHMADVLKVEPILIVARQITPEIGPVTTWPVGTAGIPNNHLQYLITWFSLAAIWLGMTVYWVWRIRRREDG